LHGPTIASLFDAQPALSRALDLKGVRQFLNRQPDGVHTCFAAARLVPAGNELWRNEVACALRQMPEPEPRTEALLTLLERAVAGIVASGRRIALALSGGLDSALVLRLANNAVPVFTLATGLKDYCELNDTVTTAEKLGLQDLNVIRVDADHLISALPEAITACETPLFNLHPISKWLLARELQARGFDAMLTGDGADQVFAGADPRNYLPIVGALARAAGAPS
jgi:asparagine synthetase B (glutamine-hydrolysing)